MKRLLLSLALAAVAGSAHAQLGQPNPDSDHDGKVTFAEFKAAQTDRLMARLDANSDGRISKAESKPMEDMAARFGGAAGQARVAELWAKGDTNNDANLSRAELEAASKRRFDAGDANHDGWLSKGELLTMRQNRGGGR